MTERPILFSGPMVRAILEGRKTQTRRVVNPQPELIPADVPKAPGDNGWWWPAKAVRSMVQTRDMAAFCPYGIPGDRLWVRETWSLMRIVNRNTGIERNQVVYRASLPDGYDMFGIIGHKWRPSIHLKRSDSRILLEITAVRCERLQDISEADAMAEGVTTIWPDGPRQDKGPNHYTIEVGYVSYNAPTAAGVYSMLWDQINGDGSWAANPWVWVIEFKRVTQ